VCCLISLMVSSFPITSRPPRPKCLLSEIKNLLVFFFLCARVFWEDCRGGRRGRGEAGGGERDAASSCRLRAETSGCSARKQLINERAGPPAPAAINTANIWRERTSPSPARHEHNRLSPRGRPRPLLSHTHGAGSSPHIIHPPAHFHSQSAAAPRLLACPPEPSGAQRRQPTASTAPGPGPCSRRGVKLLESNKNSMPQGPFPNSA
jgi:hypothetical protein